MEYVTPIGKIPQPQTEDDLRPISLTAYFSKVMEQFIVEWLLDIIGDKMDFRQYGGMKGNSVCHYLIELINFILYHQDNTESTAVLACLVDFSKAFNRQDHNILITKLSDLGIPGWLLKVIMAFLKDRFMKVKYKGKFSKLHHLPGGGPQGTLLGLFLFLILINDVGFDNQDNNVGETITCKKRLKEVNEIHLKYVDDLSIAESVDIKNQLLPVPLKDRPQPDPYRARTGHMLNNETSKVFNKLKDIKNYADENKMKINLTKTKLMVFNPSVTKDFLPHFEVEGTEIELVEQTKLLGVIVTSNLSWTANTDYIVERCISKMWMIRRLKKLGASSSDLLDVFCKQIRSLLEFSVPVWNSSLIGEDIAKLERVQKIFLHISLGDQYHSYTFALKMSGLQKLSERRRKLCLGFAKKSLKHEKFTTWFKPNTKQTVTRQAQPKFCEVYRRTERFHNSPLSYLTRILNNHFK